ncbi:hypothetical protein D3C87_2049510 [compost metagenome]
MGFGLNDDGGLLAVVFPPDHGLRQFHVDDPRILGVAQGENRLARLNIVQGRDPPGKGLQPRPVVDIKAAAVFVKQVIALAHAPLLGLSLAL